MIGSSFELGMNRMFVNILFANWGSLKMTGLLYDNKKF